MAEVAAEKEVAAGEAVAAETEDATEAEVAEVAEVADKDASGNDQSGVGKSNLLSELLVGWFFSF